MKIEINLAQNQYEKRLHIVFVYTVGFGLMLSAMFYNYRSISNYNTMLGVLSERNANLNKELEEGMQIANEKGMSVKDSGDLSKKINYINVIIEKQAFSWTGLIYNLEERTPDEISITEIIPSIAENNIRIIGLAKTVDDIVKYVNNLQLSSYFKDVFLLEHNDVEIEKNKLIKFIITSKFDKNESSPF